MTTFIEIALGLILIYLFASLIVTAIQEIVAAVFALRAKGLESGLKAVLDGSGAQNTPNFNAFKETPLIKALYDANGTAPSYIPARSFALAVMKMAPTAAAGAQTLTTIKAWAAGANSGAIGNVVDNLITEATTDAAALQKSIESWYDETMDRLSGWYKRWTQVTTIVFGLLAAAAFNIDSIAVWGVLSSQPAVREALANYASTISKAEKPPEFPAMLKTFKEELPLPIGWPRKIADAGKESNEYDFDKVLSSESGKKDYSKLPFVLLGWLITALAASLGSAFWFDMLKRFVQIRAAGPKPAVVEAGAGVAAAAAPGAAVGSARPAMLRDRA